MPMKKRPDADIRHKYASQKGSAKGRNIEFNLTYEQWWDIWKQSGQWENRGPGLGQYVMARKGDSGAYDVNNVDIIPASQNKTEGNLGRKCPRTPEHQAKLTASIRKTMSDPNWINPNIGRRQPHSAENGRKGAAKMAATKRGRKKVWREDGSWTWEHPNKVNQ